MSGVQIHIETPTLDKMLKVKSESQAIGNFVEWLREQGIEIGKYEKVEGYRNEQFVADRRSIEKLLADYFEIDLNKAETERRQILGGLRGSREGL